MLALLAHIRELIDKKGPMTVADYMELALQHPEHGYYRHGDPLGLEGDFTTAPEISQMFGEMLGLWCADMWRMMGQPAHFTLLEMGPGRGTLMQDALRATGKIAGFHAAMELCLLESSHTLRAAQGERLGQYVPRYIDDLAQLPQQPTIVIANEFFDALSVRQFEKTFQGWAERKVITHKDGLAFMAQVLEPPMMALIPERMHNANPGTVFEISMPSLVIMRDLAKHIAKNGGAALVVDYGYAEADGKATLQAVKGHDYADVLSDPGEVDITAHVDFATLRQAAVMQAAIAHGPVGQGEFLQTLGIELRADQLKLRANDEQKKAIHVALQRLTDPAQMGALFKVMAITSSTLTDLPGF